MEAIQQVPLLKDRCHVPEILWDMSSPRVLTMEWIDGIKMDKPQSLEAMGYSPKEVMETVVVLFSDVRHTMV